MDFVTWTKHLISKDPIRVEEEHPVEKPCPARGKRGCPRFSFDAPLEYSTRDGSAVRGAYAGNASETGLLIYSIDQLQVGADLRLLVFYPNGYQLDNFQAVARIIWKEYHCEKEWKGFKYGLEFVYMSDTDRRKLREILKKTLIQQSDLWKQGADPGLQAMEATP